MRLKRPAGWDDHSGLFGRGSFEVVTWNAAWYSRASACAAGARAAHGPCPADFRIARRREIDASRQISPSQLTRHPTKTPPELDAPKLPAYWLLTRAIYSRLGKV